MFVEWGEAADRPASPKGRERPRLCENAPSRDLLRILFPGRALTIMSEDFLAAVSPKSRPKFYFEKERPSFHTARTKSRHSAPRSRGTPAFCAQPQSKSRQPRSSTASRILSKLFHQMTGGMLFTGCQGEPAGGFARAPLPVRSELGTRPNCCRQIASIA